MQTGVKQGTRNCRLRSPQPRPPMETMFRVPQVVGRHPELPWQGHKRLSVIICWRSQIAPPENGAGTFRLSARPPQTRQTWVYTKPGLMGLESSRLILPACPPDLCLSSRNPFGGSLRGGFAGGGVWVCPLGSPTHPSANPPLSHL